jgi:sporulation protein YlmC with PRC-barrel domain
MSAASSETPGGRVRDLALHLLDRQMIDQDGKAVGNVDDVELHVPDDGSPPYVVALLSGPQALAPRLGGLLGHWLMFWSTSLTRASTEQPGRVPIELVTEVSARIKVARSRAELGLHANEDRAREYLVDRIPGARHD